MTMMHNSEWKQKPGDFRLLFGGSNDLFVFLNICVPKVKNTSGFGIFIDSFSGILCVRTITHHFFASSLAHYHYVFPGALSSAIPRSWEPILHYFPNRRTRSNLELKIRLLIGPLL